MPKATNALHRDQITTAQAGVAKSVVGRDTRAEKRGGLCGTELVRNGSNASRFRNHYFRISSIHGYSLHHRVLTIHNVSASARFAHSVLARDQADTNPLTEFPFGDSIAHGFDAADYFMSRNARQFQARVGAGDSSRVGVTDSTCFHADSDLARGGLDN
jgi:hypothetical protein